MFIDLEVGQAITLCSPPPFAPFQYWVYLQDHLFVQTVGPTDADAQLITNSVLSSNPMTLIGLV